MNVIDTTDPAVIGRLARWRFERRMLQDGLASDEYDNVRHLWETDAAELLAVAAGVTP